jgi:hypothetical protein
MHEPHFTQEQLAQVAKLSDSDIKRVNENRGTQNKLGFAYQLCYVKLFNRLPTQTNIEPVEELATFVAVQLDITRELLPSYTAQKSTFFRHQEDLCSYLHLEKFNEDTEAILRAHLLEQALQIQPTESLFIKATEFLKERRTLNPSDDTIERLIQTQREKARNYIFEKIYEEIAPPIKLALDDLLIVAESYSKLYQIKEVPQKPSIAAMKALANKLVMIEQTGVLTIKLDWLNNNYKRYFSRYVTHSDAKKLRELTPLHRYASLVCFLQEAYRDTIDHIFDMYQKAIGTMYNQADKTLIPTINQKELTLALA